MYNLWWIAIAFAIISVICIIVAFTLHGLGIDISIIMFSFCFISVVIAACCCIGAAFNTREAKLELQEFKNTYEMAQEMFQNGGDLERAGISGKAIEINQWLAKARADIEIRGNWSKYCTLNLASIEYIKLPPPSQ